MFSTIMSPWTLSLQSQSMSWMTSLTALHQLDQDSTKETQTQHNYKVSLLTFFKASVLSWQSTVALIHSRRSTLLPDFSYSVYGLQFGFIPVVIQWSYSIMKRYICKKHTISFICLKIMKPGKATDSAVYTGTTTSFTLRSKMTCQAS